MSTANSANSREIKNEWGEKMKKYDNIIKKARKIFKKSKNSHDMDHTMRVYKMCMHIAETETCNVEVLSIAAFLHDIGRMEQDEAKGKICHAAVGAKKAKKILEKYNIDKVVIERVIHCISTHRYRGQNKPESIEAKILYDADKLDAIGAIGISRAFVFAGEIGAKVHNKNIKVEKTKSYTDEDTAYREYLVKLRFIKDKMLTKEGRKIAEERHRFMEMFFERLNKETDAEM